MSVKFPIAPREIIDFTRLRWRFVICAASFYVNVVAWGFISSTGIFEDAFKDTYHLSSFKSALPGSVQIASMSVLSVVSSILTTKYGVRGTTLSGAFISAIGSILAAVIGEFWAYCLFYGLLVGAGEAIMLVPAVLAVPPYFHSSCVSLATASAVSGASIGMLAIPFLLQFLLNTYGLRGATLLGSCLWLSVSLAGALFGQGVTSIEKEDISTLPSTPKLTGLNDQEDNEAKPRLPTQQQTGLTRRRSITPSVGLIYSRRTSLVPTATHHQQQQHRRFSSLYQQQHHNNDRLTVKLPTIYEGFTANTRDDSKSSLMKASFGGSVNSPIASNTTRLLNTNAHSITPLNDQSRSTVVPVINVARTTDTTQDDPIYKHLAIPQYEQQIQAIPMKDSKHLCCRAMHEIRDLLRINIFRVLIVSIILIWSLDETNFLFLTDLLKSTGQSEQRSTLLIAVIGAADLVGQLFFGYLGDVECVDSFVLWTCASIAAGLALSAAPFIALHGIAGLCILFAIHAFFLSAPNALGHVIMIEVVGMHRYAMAYGLSLLVSGSASLFGYPMLGLLKDKTQSWTIPFALVGAIMVLGGLVAGTIPLYAYYQDRKRQSQAGNHLSTGEHAAII